MGGPVGDREPNASVFLLYTAVRHGIREGTKMDADGVEKEWGN